MLVRAGLLSREALLTDFTHRFCGVFWLFPHGPGLARFEVGGGCECVCQFSFAQTAPAGVRGGKQGFMVRAIAATETKDELKDGHMDKEQKRIASWESPSEQIPSLRGCSCVVAHQCDINGDQQSHLCAYIWYLMNKNKMRLSFTLKEWNLTSPHKQLIDNWPGLRRRSSLGTVLKGLTAMGHIRCPDVRLGSYCIFHILKLANLPLHNSFHEQVIWVTRLRTNAVASINSIGLEKRGEGHNPWPRNYRMPK